MWVDIEKVLVSREQIEQRTQELGQEITEAYHGRAPILVGVLKGALPFLVDLARVIDLPVTIDFMAVSSYGASTKSSGIVRIIKDLDVDVAGRDVLVVEDIVDSGLTLSYILETIRRRGPGSLEVCALLDKAPARKIAVPLRYTGFVIPDEFVVGYGLDFNELYRNLPFVGVLRQVSGGT